MTDELLQKINEKLELIAFNQQEIFTMAEACEYLKISRTAFSKEIQEGNVRFKSNGSRYLFKKKWLDEWMEM